MSVSAHKGRSFRTGLRRRGAMLLGAMLPLVVGCSSGSETGVVAPNGDSSESTATIGLTEALSMIEHLERYPLSAEASSQRTILTAWSVASTDITPFALDDSYIRPIHEGDHPYGPELFLQYMFGVARGHTSEARGTSEVDAIESGLRSMLAAYKSMLVEDETLRDPFLDDLDRLRQKGSLREYILDVWRRR